LGPSELLEIQIEWAVYHITCGYVACVPDGRGSVNTIKCTVHYIVHILCTFLSVVRMKVRDSDVLAWVRGQWKMSQILGVFGMLDFTVLRPVLGLRAFGNL
jgi:hypothetical protein